ncbi:ANR family transcriptional regulator [Vibrio vulnificus]|uniref:ANR family transcriptional regulator n=1 Tax=Vibrio vulnificus TaxID=672 RepID=UPI001A1E9043|nr:ANR family transcriptional regulator [Vibrio vulnificus]HAS6423197.1 ANR family transcriptional regulator [Vibrio vulnificus]HBH7890667.1 ANR family transcriptional regulator [Vibrio vulnificus]
MIESSWYLTWAEQAAQAEREGRYREAAARWLNSSEVAFTETNRHWATCRAEFCSKRGVMG